MASSPLRTVQRWLPVADRCEKLIFDHVVRHAKLSAEFARCTAQGCTTRQISVTQSKDCGARTIL